VNLVATPVGKIFPLSGRKLHTKEKPYLTQSHGEHREKLYILKAQAPCFDP
jgi:hypothetical protein